MALYRRGYGGQVEEHYGEGAMPGIERIPTR